MYLERFRWEDAERLTSWAQSKNAPPTGWDDGADGWQRRIEFEKEFTEAQVDACSRITKDKTVLDACCGTGRTAIPFAEKARHVFAVDAAPHMLAYCRKNAEEKGIKNIDIIQIENWHTCIPGKEFPIADIAVSVIGPPQADILNFSKFAKEYCYILSFSKDRYMIMIQKLFKGTQNDEEEKKIRQALSKNQREANPDEEALRSRAPGLNMFNENAKNKFLLDIQFNILFSHGAKPTVNYADGAWSREAETKEELYDYLAGFGQVSENKMDVFRSNCDRYITKTESGLFRYAYESEMYVLGWDPRELDI